ncbi:hypothetical protein [Shewanella pneumatophori]|uniref:Uncharacterized protein n=1 Tax=Shewanella pneumatophori TaxID=314092 RepID=A0A9X1Z8X7_9GAMM|nr:hypothetical protein [Shewanella pneumatophori]MCL1137754.1 hypothetical protein [Shewanella pneumatophori]
MLAATMAIAEANYCVTSSLTTRLPKGMSSLFAAGRLVLRFFMTSFSFFAFFVVALLSVQVEFR